jgi:hypothetical protein
MDHTGGPCGREGAENAADDGARHFFYAVGWRYPLANDHRVVRLVSRRSRLPKALQQMRSRVAEAPRDFVPWRFSDAATAVPNHPRPAGRPRNLHKSRPRDEAWDPGVSRTVQARDIPAEPRGSLNSRGYLLYILDTYCIRLVLLG